MFEGAVAAMLNRLLGRYVEDLDTEQLNIGIFSGDTYLTDLKLKPEALYQLGLPIRVEIGLIGKITLKIPWTGLFSQPIILCVEDIYIVAVSEVSGCPDAELQKRLARAAKRKILEDLEGDGLPAGLFDSLMTSVIRNFHITVTNVHVRYEERLEPDLVTACGLCIQNLSMTTTNSKWKPGVTSPNSATVYQLIRAESLSVYLDPVATSCLGKSPAFWDLDDFYEWKSSMREALQTFGMRNQEFHFLIKPFTTKIKVIVHKGTEVHCPRMLVDIVLQDVAMQLSQEQCAALCRFYDALRNASISRRYKKYATPESEAETGETRSWRSVWRFAYRCVLEDQVRPYTWRHLRTHRENYRRYKDAYAQILSRPRDTELRLDLQKYEDHLTILNIVVARQQAKMELRRALEKERQDQGESTDVDVVVENDFHVSVDLGSFEQKEKEKEKERKELEDERSNGELGFGNDGRIFAGFIESSRDGKQIHFDKLPKFIDHKYNFTLANCSLSLLTKNREILVVTVTQFLTSIETHPETDSYKISARAESFVVEGASSDNDLVPLMSADSVLTGNVSTNFFALDFEKNPTNSSSDYDLTVTLEPIEMMYHHNAMMELASFLDFGTGSGPGNLEEAVPGLYKIYRALESRLLRFAKSVVTRRLRINFKMDIKAPYVIFPERGSIQEDGYVLILDFGNAILRNELQAADVQLEDVTMMELEELFYDRVHVDFTGGQILLCHSGDDWRSTRGKKDSENHFIPKLQANVTLSYSIRSEYRQLPRVKLNISVSHLKVNLSEAKVKLVTDFLEMLPLPTKEDIRRYRRLLENAEDEVPGWDRQDFSSQQLRDVRAMVSLSTAVLERRRLLEKESNGSHTLSEFDSKSAISSEINEEDLELWTRNMNLLGFDDSTSPQNRIDLLLRFVIGELYLNVSYSKGGTERAYLNLRLSTVYLETARMEYGPAVQFGIGTVLLADKTNAGITGSYLELLSTDESYEVLQVSYRKVRADCPDFKSHFKSIERSLIVNVTNVNVVFHRHAFLRLKEYWNGLSKICENKVAVKNVYEMVKQGIVFWRKRESDPPIPSGAIKLSYSARLNSLSLKFCNTDIDLIETKILGLESDCIYTANERMILRAHLRSLIVEDLDEDTLFSKILTTDEDKVFDLKYVRHTPRLYVCPDIDARQDDVTSDGSFKLSIGRINCVFVTKMLYDIQYFLGPFVHLLRGSFFTGFKDCLRKGLEDFRVNSTKLQLSIEFQGPVFLLPQRKDAPSLLILDTGILSVENFLKRNGGSAKSSSGEFSSVAGTGTGAPGQIIDNILIKLTAVSVSRAIMTLSRNLEMQEPIIDPIDVRLDVKRRTEYRSQVGFQAYGLCSLQGTMDAISVNLSRRDFKSVLSVWEDNISKIQSFVEFLQGASEDEDNGREMTRTRGDPVKDERMVQKLEAFLSQNEPHVCEISMKFSLDGFQLYLFSDSDEVLSSPVRDLSHGLCKLQFGEAIATLDIYSDRKLNLRFSMQTCTLEDTRKDSVVVRKIIQAPAKTIGINPESHISVSMSPVVNLTFTQAPAGDRCYDILIEETRVNFSIPFFVHLAHYFMDSLPTDVVDEGVVNQAYESSCQPTQPGRQQDDAGGERKGSYEEPVLFEEQPGTSVSLRIQKPEVLLFSDLQASNAHAILIQGEVTFESSQHAGESSVVCTFSDVRAKSKSQRSYLRQFPQWVLRPCDIELSMKERLPELNLQLDVNVNPINLHLCAGTVQTFLDIFRDACNLFKPRGPIGDWRSTNWESTLHVDLWTPKKVLYIPYKKSPEDVSNFAILKNLRENQKKSLELKPVPITCLLEMEDTLERIPMVRGEMVLSLVVNEESDRKFQLESMLKVHAFCYNVQCGSWEPLIELCSKDDVHYKPWEINIKMYRDEAYLLNPNWTVVCEKSKDPISKRKRKEMDLDEEAAEDMVFIRPDRNVLTKFSAPILNSGYEEKSETEDDEDSDKIASRNFHRLFTADSSDEDVSDSDESSKYEDEGFELTPECSVQNCPTAESQTGSSCTSTYILIHAEDILNVTVTKNNVSTLQTILNTFAQNRSGIPIVPVSAGKLILQNDIGHDSRLELFVKDEESSSSGLTLIAAKDFQTTTSSPISVPSSPEAEAFSDFISFSAAVNGETRSSLEKSSVFSNLTDAVSRKPVLFADESLVDVYKNVTEERLHVILEGFDDIFVYCPRRRSYKLVPLQPAKHGLRYYVIVETTINEYLHRTISVRSPLQILNETSYALGLYYKKQQAERLGLKKTLGEAINPFDDNIRMTILEPDHTYNVPLFLAYHCPIYILPAYLENYQVSDSGICWKDLSENLNTPRDVYCNLKDSPRETTPGLHDQHHPQSQTSPPSQNLSQNQTSPVFGVKVLCCENNNVSTRPSCHVPHYLLRILPPLVLSNNLPFVIDLSVASIGYEVRVEPGERINLYHLKCDDETSVVIKVQSYMGVQWTGCFKLTGDFERKLVKMNSVDHQETEITRSFVLCVQLERSCTWMLVVYAQYWIINKTGLPLCLQVSPSNRICDIPEGEPIVFSQKESRKSVVRLKAQQSGWSSGFRLEGVNSMSLIMCKDVERRRKYRILSKVEASRLSPLSSRIVTFLPYFFIRNRTKKSLRFMEENDEADLWNDLPPGQGVPFWPYTESMKIRVKWKNSQLVSQHFDITTIGKTVLRMDNGSALCVELEGGENSPYCVTFRKYQPGDAPVRVDNFCEDLFLKVNQLNLGQAALLSPFQSLLYTWDDPTKPRELVWNVYNNKTKGYVAQFRTDGFGQETVSFRTLKRPLEVTSCQSTSHSGTTFIRKPVNAETKFVNSGVDNSSNSGGSSSSDGSDSENENDRTLEQVRKDKAVVFWVSYMEGEQRVLLFTQDENIFLKVRSVVDPEVSDREIFVAFAGFGLSTVAKSCERINELAYFSVTDSAAHWDLCLGKKWKTLTLELSAWIENKYRKSCKNAILQDFIDVDLVKMHMTKPFFGKLRRIYSPGFFLHCRKSMSFTYLQGYVHRIQIDNQLPNARYPIVFHSGAEKCFSNNMTVHKLRHSVEFFALKQRKAHHDVYKGINVVFREFNLNLEEEFLLRLVTDLLPKPSVTKCSIAARLRKDLSTLHTPPFSSHDTRAEGETRESVVEHFFVSPVILNLRLLASSEKRHGAVVQPPEDSSSEYQDLLKFVFDYASRGNIEKSAEFRLPYYEGKNFAVQPKDLLLGLMENYRTQLMQQFYVQIKWITILGNPYRYNFKSPEESFYHPESLNTFGDETAEKLSHDVSCLLKFRTVDPIRSAGFNFNFTVTETSYVSLIKDEPFHTTEVPLSIFIVNNTYFIDVELEIAGLAIRPTDDFHQDELKYFFKYLEKGILGLTKKENSSGSITDTIKRAQEVGYEFIARVRLPRYVNPYSGVELYSSHKARGVYLLNTIGKGHYANSDTYWAHAVLSANGKHIALVSLQRVFLIERGNSWSSWNVKWFVEINRLLLPPTIIDKKLILHVNKIDTPVSSPVVDWFLESKDLETLEWLSRKINIAMVLNLENNLCPDKSES